METNEKKNRIPSGRCRDIAAATGFTVDYVSKVLRGERFNEKIIAADAALNNMQQKLIKKLQEA